MIHLGDLVHKNYKLDLTEEDNGKINITRLPNATTEYDPAQFDQMIRLLEQIVFLLNTNFQQDLREEAESETFFLG